MEQLEGDLQAGAEPALDLDLGGGRRLGRVTRVGSAHLVVELDEPSLAAHVTVSDLVAVPAGEGFLVGLVDAVEEPAPFTLQLMPLGMYAGGAFTRGMSAYPHVGGACLLLDGERLRTFMSSLGAEVADEHSLVLGHYAAERGSLAVADGNRLFQRHVALLGSTGAGKSWGVALLLERAAQLPQANLIVFDLHGEYGPLTRPGPDGAPPIARALRIAGPADLGRSGPDTLYLPYWLLRREELMTLVLNPQDPFAPDQILRFTEHVQTLKEIALEDAGRRDALDTFTFDSPIPYRLESLLRKLRDDNVERIPRPPGTHVDPGPYFGRMTGLISRMEARAADPRYGFIFDPPEETLRYEWLGETVANLLASGGGGQGIKILDLSEVPADVLPVVAGVLARLILDVQAWVVPAERTPVCLVCDEAHLYLPPRDEGGPVHRVALQAFEGIAKEGRKYGVGLLVVSQRPTDLSRTILSQCNNFVVMRMTNDHDQAIIRRVAPETLAGLTDVLPVLEVGEAIVIGDALLLPARVKLDAPVVRPASATQPYWSLWATRPASGEALAAGVEALRKRLRGERR
jgi:uncharacterized protein DUF87